MRVCETSFQNPKHYADPETSLRPLLRSEMLNDVPFCCLEDVKRYCTSSCILFSDLKDNCSILNIKPWPFLNPKIQTTGGQMTEKAENIK